MGYPIIDIEGIGPSFKKKLKAIGINRTDQLLECTAKPKGRRTLAEESGIDESKILKWSSMADPMRVRGVGEEYSELLEAAGVDTVRELRKRKPENLAAAMAEANARKKKKLVRMVPGERSVAKWVAHARELKPMMWY